MASDRGLYKDERKKSEEKKQESSRKKKPNMKKMNEAFTKKNFTRQQRLATYHSRNFITNSAFKWILFFKLTWSFLASYDTGELQFEDDLRI